MTGTEALAGVASGVAVVAVGAALGHLVRGRITGRRRAARGRGRATALAASASVPAAVAYGRAVARAAPYTGPGGGRRVAIDLTWSALNTWAGALFLGANQLAGHRLDVARSRGTGSLWIVEGSLPGYATTIGIVKAGSTDAVDAHEMVHVLQARLFGPLYLPSVALNYVVATLVPYWWPYRDRRRWPITGVSTYFRNGVYPHVWNEHWAYRATDPRPTA